MGILKKPSHKGKGGVAISWMNAEEFRKGETASAGSIASARGLAKLGAFMVHRGTYKGETLMSKETWEEMHAEPKVLFDQGIRNHNTFTKGGIHYFNYSLLTPA